MQHKNKININACAPRCMHGLVYSGRQPSYTSLKHIVKTSLVVEWIVLITGKSFSSYWEAERLLLYVAICACVENNIILL